MKKFIHIVVISSLLCLSLLISPPKAQAQTNPIADAVVLCSLATLQQSLLLTLGYASGNHSFTVASNASNPFLAFTPALLSFTGATTTELLYTIALTQTALAFCSSASPGEEMTETYTISPEADDTKAAGFNPQTATVTIKKDENTDPDPDPETPGNALGEIIKGFQLIGRDCPSSDLVPEDSTFPSEKPKFTWMVTVDGSSDVFSGKTMDEVGEITQDWALNELKLNFGGLSRNLNRTLRVRDEDGSKVRRNEVHQPTMVTVDSVEMLENGDYMVDHTLTFSPNITGTKRLVKFDARFDEGDEIAGTVKALRADGELGKALLDITYGLEPDSRRDRRNKNKGLLLIPARITF